MPHLLNPLYDAVSWVLLRFHDFWSLIFPGGSGAAWGLSIVGLVVLVRIILIPLFVKQIKAQRGMQALQPQMAALKKKYGSDRQKFNEEMMKLYKDTGTNPLSSCLPLLVQSPFFIALFHVLSNISHNKRVGVLNTDDVNSFHGATVFGAPIYDTFTKADTVSVRIVAVVLILLMTASTFITQRQLMVKNMPLGQDNPMAQQQKIMLYAYPFIFAVVGFNFPIGTLIYWLTTNFWTMGQQFYVIRRNPTPGSAAYEALEARRKAHDKARGLLEPEVVTEALPAPKRQQPKRKPRSQRRPPRPGSTPPKSAGPDDSASEHAVAPGDSPDDDESKEAS